MTSDNPARDAFRARSKQATADGGRERGFFGDGVSLMLHAAKSGDLESLALHIESGGSLDAQEAKFVADFLRGVAPIERRKLCQRIMEYKYVFVVDQYMKQGKSETAAIEAALDQFPDLNESTLENYLTNWKNGK